MSNTLIARNDPYGGGVCVIAYYTPSVSRAVLANDTSADHSPSGVVAHFYGVVTSTNNLIAGHATGIETLTPFSGTVSADTNLFWNSSDLITGTNGLLQDPQLTGNYHLGQNFPALDTGVTISWLTTDLDGRPRP